MIYAFSRDGAVPGHRFWHKVNPRTGTPTNSIWLATVGAFILFLPYLYNPNAYAAVISIAVIGLYIAYGIPIFLRLRAGSDAFVRGPWHLGRWSRPIGIIAVVWVCIICVLFVLPTVFPVTLGNLNHNNRCGRSRWSGHRDMVAGLRAALVQGPPGPGICRGARSDRGGARRSRHARCRIRLSELQAARRPHVQPAARRGLLRSVPAGDRVGGGRGGGHRAAGASTGPQ